MAAGEDDAFSIGGKITARRAATTGAHQLRFASRKCLLVNLIEHVLPRHGLIDDGLAVGGEIAFAGFREVGR